MLFFTVFLEALFEFEWFLTFMDLALEHRYLFALFVTVHVLFHIASTGKSLRTVNTSIRLFTRVQPRMPLEVTILGERLVTKRTFEPAFRMYFCMSLQLGRFFIRLVAFIAFIWTIFTLMNFSGMNVELSLLIEKLLAVRVLAFENHVFLYGRF